MGRHPQNIFLISLWGLGMFGQSCREKLGIFAEFVLEVALSRNFQYVRHMTWFLDYYLIIFLV